MEVVIIVIFSLSRYFLQPRENASSRLSNKGDLGALRINLHYTSDTVFMSHCYDSFRNLILQSCSQKVCTSFLGDFKGLKKLFDTLSNELFIHPDICTFYLLIFYEYLSLFLYLLLHFSCLLIMILYLLYFINFHVYILVFIPSTSTFYRHFLSTLYFLDVAFPS